VALPQRIALPPQPEVTLPRRPGQRLSQSTRFVGRKSRFAVLEEKRGRESVLLRIITVIFLV